MSKLYDNPYMSDANPRVHDGWDISKLDNLLELGRTTCQCCGVEISYLKADFGMNHPTYCEECESLAEDIKTRSIIIKLYYKDYSKLLNFEEELELKRVLSASITEYSSFILGERQRMIKKQLDMIREENDIETDYNFCETCDSSDGLCQVCYERSRE